MKRLARAVVAKILGYQVRKLRTKNNIKIVAVAGSIGKTSTKLAVAKVLSQNFSVRYQEGNYNDLVSVPLVFFDQELPSLYNPLSWLTVFWSNQKQLRNKYPYEIVVVELGSDGPGQISQFKKYLKNDIGLITSITPEHMEFFDNLDEVAKEELALSDFSSLILANADLCDQKYLADLPDKLTYAFNKPADYKLEGQIVKAGNTSLLEIPGASLSEPELYSKMAAAIVAYKLGMPAEDIQKALENVKPFSGRMQKLNGVNGSTIIDDSYNASPAAVKLALDSLYKLKAPQKIAVLGNMNELGSYSEAAHKEIGNYTDPSQLDMVITIGPDANKYLAAAAKAKGCTVQEFDSPYEAGEYLKQLVKPGAIVLIKGSQNRVFAEETAKILLADPKDADKLVRQSQSWLDTKQKAFTK